VLRLYTEFGYYTVSLCVKVVHIVWILHCFPNSTGVIIIHVKYSVMKERKILM